MKKKELEIDVYEIESFLVGHCGYTCEQVLDLTFRDYLHKREAFNQKSEQQWAMIRWGAWNHYILSPYIKPHQKPKSPSDLFKLPSERAIRHVVDTRTAEEKQEAREFFASMGAKMIN